MKQNQAVILVVIIAILLLGAFVFYFRKEIQTIFSPNKPSVTDKTTQEPKNRIVRDKEGKQINVKVKTSSLMQGYEVSLNSEPGLVDTLINWGVFGKTYGKTKEEVEVENMLELVTVTLTDKKQPFLLEGNNNEELASSAGFELNGKELKIFVYIAPGSLAQADALFEKQALRMLFGVAYPPVKGQEQAIADTFNNYLNDKISKKIKYFTVIKK